MFNGNAKDFKELIKWQEIPVANGLRSLGKIEEIVSDKNKIEVFPMSYPINNSIGNKQLSYKILLD